VGQDSFRAVRASKTISEDLSLKRASPGFWFHQRECATSRREFLCNNFFSSQTKFPPGTLPRFCSRQDSRRDPGGEFFSWRDLGHPLGEYRFLGEILTEIRGGNFSRVGSRRENGPPRRDPGGIPVSAGNLGIPWDPATHFTLGLQLNIYLISILFVHLMKPGIHIISYTLRGLRYCYYQKLMYSKGSKLSVINSQ